LEAAGRAYADDRPHEQAEIEAAEMDEQPFQNGDVTAEMGAGRASSSTIVTVVAAVTAPSGPDSPLRTLRCLHRARRLRWER
jgi:hypothetical protein